MKSVSTRFRNSPVFDYQLWKKTGINPHEGRKNRPPEWWPIILGKWRIGADAFIDLKMDAYDRFLELKLAACILIENRRHICIVLHNSNPLAKPAKAFQVFMPIVSADSWAMPPFQGRYVSREELELMARLEIPEIRDGIKEVLRRIDNNLGGKTYVQEPRWNSKKPL